MAVAAAEEAAAAAAAAEEEEEARRCYEKSLFPRRLGCETGQLDSWA